MKKKVIAILIILSLTITAFGLTKFDSVSDDFSNWLKGNVYSNYDELKTAFKEAGSSKKIAEYMYKWGEENGFKSQKVGKNSVLITKLATEGYESVPKVALHGTLDPGSIGDTAQCASIAMSAIKGSISFGQVSILLTSYENGQFVGAESISQEYLDFDHLISLDKNKDTNLITSTPSSISMEMDSSLSYNAPSGDIAYQVTLSGLRGSELGETPSENPNPIVILANFMSRLNAASVYYDYTDFVGGQDISRYPSSAQVTLVFDESGSEKFKTRFESLVSTFDDDYYDHESGYKLEYKEVETPLKVIGQDDQFRILSLLYTLPDGKYATTEEDKKGDVLAISNIGAISTEKHFYLSVVGRSIVPLEADNMINDYQTAAALSDIEFSVGSSYAPWKVSDKSDTYKRLKSACKGANIGGIKGAASFVPSATSIFEEKNPELNQLVFQVNNSESFEQSMALVYFIRDLKK